MISHDIDFSAYLPCRITLIQDPEGKPWLVTLDLDKVMHTAKLPPELMEQAILVRDNIREALLLLRRRCLLMPIFPIVIRHTVDDIASNVVAHIQPPLLGGAHVPLGQTVAASSSLLPPNAWIKVDAHTHEGCYRITIIRSLKAGAYAATAATNPPGTGHGESRMTQLLSLSRAARLAGVTRSDLQKRIRRGEITTFEGEVAVSDLLRVYPEVTLEQSGDLERVERIKANALPKSHQGDGALPTAQVLISRLKSVSEVLVEKATALDAAEAILAELDARLATMVESAAPETAVCTREIQAWLAAERHKLARRPDAENRAQLLARDTFLRILAANVKIIPSGHDYFVEGSESILDASVRAGLKLAYGCSSGNCGACKARVVSGEVRKTREHDYVLSGREKQMGYILTCSNTAVTDVVLEAAEAVTVDDLPEQEIRASVRKLEKLGNDMIHLQIQTPRTQTLRFMAGQRVLMTLEDGKRRELAVASCPCDGRNLQFLLRRGVGDGFAESLLTGGHGQTLLIEGPRGDFLLEEEATEPAVFVAVGDGFAPIKSLAEHAIAIDNAASLNLFRVDDSPPGGQLDNLCRSWNDALDNFTYRRLAPEVGPAEAAQAIADAFADLARYRLYVAGPADYVDSLIERLNGLGVRAENTHADRIAVA